MQINSFAARQQHLFRFLHLKQLMILHDYLNILTALVSVNIKTNDKLIFCNHLTRGEKNSLCRVASNMDFDNEKP